MSVSTICLVSPDTFAPRLIGALQRHSRSVLVQHHDTMGLEAPDAMTEVHGDRLIAFNCPVIFPSVVLERFQHGCYNIHAGSPAYPGRFSTCMAIYDAVRQFGVTAHAMIARVDAGPIVATKWFDVDPQMSRQALESQTASAMLELFDDLSSIFVHESSPLPALRIEWSGQRVCSKSVKQICNMPPDIDNAECKRRIRAFAGLPDIDVCVNIGGYHFSYVDKTMIDPIATKSRK